MAAGNKIEDDIKMNNAYRNQVQTKESQNYFTTNKIDVQAKT